MELRDAIRRRRMVRRFDPGRDVPAETLRDLVGLAARAPSAGFTQGWDVVALHDAPARDRFWHAATPPEAADRGDAWLAGVRSAPVLLLWVSDPQAYVRRYAEPDKGWAPPPDGRVDTDRWPVPYWDTDAAMAVMVLLLAAVDAGLGALFFGVPGPRHTHVKRALSVPADRRIVGVVALGHEAERVGGSGTRRRRRPLDEVLHDGSLYAAPPPGVSLTNAVGPVGEDDGDP